MATKTRSKKAKTRRKAKAASSEFDVAAWAKEQPSPRHRPHRCSVCDHAEVVPVIRQIMELKAAGQTEAGIEAIHQMLRREFGFERSVSTLKRHMKHCEAELWEVSYGAQ